MKRAYFIFLIEIMLGFAAHGQKTKEYFEGTVRYRISYTPLRENFTETFLQDRYGAYMDFSITKGLTKKSYYNNAGKLIQTRIYESKTNTNSMFVPGKDTLYQYHSDKTDFTVLEYTTTADSMINGKMLSGMKVVVKDKNPAAKL